MDHTSERLSRTVWIGVGLLIVILCLAVVSSRLEKSSRAVKLPVLGSISDFTLTNQSGQRVTLADFRGRVWVADIIFSRCAGPCPRMTRQMEAVQNALPPGSGAKLVTLTTDPTYDTPEILRKYPEHIGVKAGERWSFLTGSKDEVLRLAIDSLKLTAIEKEPGKRESAEDLFIHSTIFVVVDKQARLRGVFETGGEGVEWTNVQPAMVSVIRQLERER